MQDRLTEIKAREAAATPGPWDSIGVTNYEQPAIWTDDGFTIIYDHDSDSGFTILYDHDSDSDFIVKSRQDIPWLIEQVERLQAENERLKRDR